MDLNQNGRVKQTTASHGQHRRVATRFASIGELRGVLANLRARLEPAFGPETAVKQSTRSESASAGQCSAVATIVRAMLGGELVSAHVDTQSHWFNRVPVGGVLFDIDITGDQFGLPPIQMARRGKLYGGSRVRQPVEVDENTRRRAALLARRAGVDDDLNTSALTRQV
jgi:hypothetical protein